MSDGTVLLIVFWVLLTAFVAGLVRIAVPLVRGLWAAQTADVAERLAVLSALPLDCEPFDYAEHAARLLAVVLPARGCHRGEAAR